MTVYLNLLRPISSFQHHDCMVIMLLLNVLANVKQLAFSRVNAVLTYCSKDVPEHGLNWY
jgi:hypothetical protein